MEGGLDHIAVIQDTYRLNNTTHQPVLEPQQTLLCITAART